MKKPNKEVKAGLPPLCAAVRFVRKYYGDTQERFARRVGIATMTLSKFETGRAEPRDPRVLLNLVKITDNAEFIEGQGQVDLSEASAIFEGGDFMTNGGVARLLREAYEDYERTRQTDRAIGELESIGQPGVRSLREWRLSCAVRLAAVYFPEQVTAIERAAAPSLQLIDEILSGADETRIDYARFERDVFTLAERRTLLELKGRKK